MTVREFTHMCKDHGFARTAPYIYARWLGDGVLQTIDISRMVAISPENSTLLREKSRFISIGISSMYADWSETCFVPEFYAWQIYSPDSFLGRNPSTEPFRGFDSHCTIMQEHGFAYLDAISSQSALLDAKLKLDIPICGGHVKWYYASWLAAPLALCKQWDEAMYEVCRHYTQSWEAFHSNNRHLILSEQYNAYCRKEQEFRREMANTRHLWHLLLISDYDALYRLLRDNYEKNAQYAQKHGIPFV